MAGNLVEVGDTRVPRIKVGINWYQFFVMVLCANFVCADHDTGNRKNLPGTPIATILGSFTLCSVGDV